MPDNDREPKEKQTHYRLRDYLLAALFPPRCHLCGERFNPRFNGGESTFFGERPIRSPFCSDCTTALSRLYRPTLRQTKAGVCRHLFAYSEETVQKLIFHIKFCNCSVCHAFAGTIVACAVERFYPDADAVIGIPRSVPLMKKYGFDQTAEMLKPYQKMPRTAPVLDALYRDPDFSKEQKGLSARERRFNAFRSLRIRNNVRVPHSVCVLDDIITTGATAEAAAYLLQKAGAEKICFLFLAAAERLDYDEDKDSK